VRIRRVRLQNAKLDFTDLSLLPQFAAKIYELQGVVTGLSSSHATRSRIELDGRVDEFAWRASAASSTHLRPATTPTSTSCSGIST
jgi:hypothetical protein